MGTWRARRRADRSGCTSCSGRCLRGKQQSPSRWWLVGRRARGHGAAPSQWRFGPRTDREQLRDRQARHLRHDGAGSKAAALGMVFELLKTAEERWRRFNGPRAGRRRLAGATFIDGISGSGRAPNNDRGGGGRCLTFGPADLDGVAFGATAGHPILWRATEPMGGLCRGLGDSPFGRPAGAVGVPAEFCPTRMASKSPTRWPRASGSGRGRSDWIV
jgi:hypothetical protein